MSTYYKSSDYYPDDKDIFDFLSSTGAPFDEMRQFLSTYGILLSKRNNKADIQAYVSQLYLSWPQAVRLIDIIDLRESREHSTSVEFDVHADIAALKTACEAVRQLRSEVSRESYIITPKANSVEVQVTYLDTDTGRTRVLQKRPRDLRVTIEITNEGLDVRYTNNGTAAAIVENIVGEILESLPEEKQDFTKRRITFSGIHSIAHRVQFFKDLMTGMEGLSVKDVVHLKIERLKNNEKSDADEEAEEEEEKAAEEAVKRVILYGNKLFETEDFQELVDRGFFVSNATWRAEIDAASPDQLELTAGFNDPDTCEEFQYNVVGQYFSEDGKLKKRAERVPEPSGSDFTRRLEVSARKAFTKASEGAKLVVKNKDKS